MEQVIRSLGPTAVIKGELSAREDLVIEGRLEGMVDLNDSQLMIGPSAVVDAHVLAGNVVVVGHLTGKVVARGRVEIKPQGRVQGDITASAVAIADGAQFQGRIEMPRDGIAKSEPARAALAQVNQLLSAS